MRNFIFNCGTAIIGSLLSLSCGNSKKAEQQQGPPPAIPVSVYKVGAEDVTGIDSYPGTVIALNEVELRGEVGGYITGIFFQDGQQVNKGQKLYEIDKSRYEAAYRQAQANLQIARSNRDKAKKDADRYTRLAEQDAVAKQRVDYALTDLANAESQIAGAEAALANTAADLKRSVIVSPLRGKIGISQVKLGALVSPGTTLLNTVSNDNPIGVDISIGQEEIPRFINLQQSGRTAKDSVFTVELPGAMRYKLPGKILVIDRAIDPQTGTIRVRISYPNAKGNLRPGMNCTVKVLNQSAGKQIVIPYKAVSEQLGEFTVFVVGDSSKAEQRSVKLGIQVADKVVIEDGLKEGETIVNEGVQNVRNGSKVQAAQPGKQPEKPAAAKK